MTITSDERESGAGSACAKAILAGEHAAVFGRPAVAIPLPQLRASATLERGNPRGSGVLVRAPGIGKKGFSDQDGALAPLSLAVELAFSMAGLPATDLTLSLNSSIPPSRGLGSGAAVAAASVRACGAMLGREFAPDEVSAAVFEVEKLHHGNPSGVDNTVVAHERPVWFAKGEGCRFIDASGFSFVLSQTGNRRPTSAMVGSVGDRFSAEPSRVGEIFDSIAGEVSETVRALLSRDPAALGRSMDRIHLALKTLGVSTPSLDRLVYAAKAAGATGAKLSGAGGGGFMIAAAPCAAAAGGIAAALDEAGGRDTFIVNLSP